ncbi:ABC transporter substrate-binding protein [Vibrio aestuarianus]|uniref:ABC transporter substrate-binding protein n=1 Tax=Vibrio aestuarianus TaxID=28171 RepID=UPI0021C45666|nr:ABC transporter substrate binding protein [Vibrio aestuarianus]MDE1211233.1 hypothetical protein [Vibrio aestuarianus]MDE1254703.1 hypothetical protein [Vibrio aestuarianus]MDE1319551.1 hypothetical protein [Vibrio aestuarianus]CAH8242289.1 conserved exported hypothetical protein [Vibrio aestuarianus]
MKCTKFKKILSVFFVLLPLSLSLLNVSLANAELPNWLGNELAQSSHESWVSSSNQDYVDFVPRDKYPRVWVLVSRKARAYDTALATMLKVYKQELANTRFRVFLLPESDSEIVQWTKRAERSADLIYTVGSKATVKLYKLYSGQRLPVVSVNAKDPVLLGLTKGYQTSGNNFAFTSLNLPADITLSFILKFQPNLKQIGVLYAKENTSAYVTQYLPLKAEAERLGIDVVPFEVNESERRASLTEVMQTKVAKMQSASNGKNDTILWLTGSSSLLERVDEINQYAQGLPLLTVVPDAVNDTERSALMSVGVSFENNAHQAALYGIRILRDNIEPHSLPVGVLSPPDISISFQQAEKIQVQMPFVLIEMASDLYAQDGHVIRSAGIAMEGER